MISVVMCSVDDARFEAASRAYAGLLGGAEYELIRIADARGMAEGYNRGLARSRGSLVIFSHDDVEFLAADFAARLLGHMERCDLLGVVGTRKLIGSDWVSAGPPYLYGQVAGRRAVGSEYVVNHWSVPARHVGKMQAVDGMFLCTRAEVARAVGFDQVTFDGFHLYDIDFSYRAFKAGYRVAVACDLFPVHDSAGDYGGEWKRYAEAFCAKTPGMCVEAIPDFTTAALVVSNREQIVAAMTHTHWE